MPVVTVVIPTFNRAHVVGRAIRSVLSQTYQDWETLVVDDASTDQTEDVVRSFEDERILFLRRAKNGGVSAAQNSGIAASRGRYICFLHSDDEFLPTNLEKQVNLLDRQTPHVGAVECGFKVLSDGHERTMLPNLNGKGYEELLEFTTGVHIGTFLIRRAMADEIRFDESLPGWEDWDFLLRLVTRCKLIFIDEPLIVIHHHSEPRLSGFAVQLKALQLLSRKYATELYARPRVRSQWHFKIARFHARLRDMRSARAEFLRSIRTWPWDISWDAKRLFLAFATLTGSETFAAIHRVYSLFSRIKRRLWRDVLSCFAVRRTAYKTVGQGNPEPRR